MTPDVYLKDRTVNNNGLTGERENGVNRTNERLDEGASGRQWAKRSWTPPLALIAGKNQGQACLPTGRLIKENLSRASPWHTHTHTCREKEKRHCPQPCLLLTHPLPTTKNERAGQWGLDRPATSWQDGRVCDVVG